MFTARWRFPPCRNMEVSIRHHSPLAVQDAEVGTPSQRRWRIEADELPGHAPSCHEHRDIDADQYAGCHGRGQPKAVRGSRTSPAAEPPPAPLLGGSLLALRAHCASHRQTSWKIRPRIVRTWPWLFGGKRLDRDGVGLCTDWDHRDQRAIAADLGVLLASSPSARLRHPRNACSPRAGAIRPAVKARASGWLPTWSGIDRAAIIDAVNRNRIRAEVAHVEQGIVAGGDACAPGARRWGTIRRLHSSKFQSKKHYCF